MKENHLSPTILSGETSQAQLGKIKTAKGGIAATAGLNDRTASPDTLYAAVAAGNFEEAGDAWAALWLSQALPQDGWDKLVEITKAGGGLVPLDLLVVPREGESWGNRGMNGRVRVQDSFGRQIVGAADADHGRGLTEDDLRDNWKFFTKLWFCALKSSKNWNEMRLCSVLTRLFQAADSSHKGSFPSDVEDFFMPLLRSSPSQFPSLKQPMTEQDWLEMFSSFFNIALQHRCMVEYTWLGYKSGYGGAVYRHGACILSLQILSWLQSGELDEWKAPAIAATMRAGVTGTEEGPVHLLKEYCDWLLGDKQLLSLSNRDDRDSRKYVRTVWSAAVSAWMEKEGEWKIKYPKKLFRVPVQENWDLNAEECQALDDLIKRMATTMPTAKVAKDVLNGMLGKDETESPLTSSSLQIVALLITHLQELPSPLATHLGVALTKSYGKVELLPSALAISRALADRLTEGRHVTKTVFKKFESAVCIWMADDEAVMSEPDYRRGPVALYQARLRSLKTEMKLTQSDLDSASTLLAAPFQRTAGPGPCAAAFQQFWATTFHTVTGRVAYPAALQPALAYFVQSEPALLKRLSAREEKQAISKKIAEWAPEMDQQRSLTTKTPVAAPTPRSMPHSVPFEQDNPSSAAKELNRCATTKRPLQFLDCVELPAPKRRLRK